MENSRFKFRAWDGKKMNYDVNLFSSLGAVKKGYFAIPHSSEANAGEVMQYTGLKDKNGKEIFEGDFVIKTVKDHGRPDTKPFLVNWVYQKAGFNISAGAKDDPKHWYEVIGNVFENPDLLK